MKKLLVLLLSAMMVFSLVACGGDDTTDGEDQQVENNVDAEDEADANDDVEVDDAATDPTTDEVVISEEAVYLAMGLDSIESLPLCEMVDLTNTVWKFAGGMFDNVEMTQDEYTEALVAGYAGMFEFVFDADGIAYMVYGGHTENPVTVTGTYAYGEDGTSVYLTFDINGTAYEYGCLLTQIDDGSGNNITVLLAIPKGDEPTGNALYFLLNN